MEGSFMKEVAQTWKVSTVEEGTLILWVKLIDGEEEHIGRAVAKQVACTTRLIWANPLNPVG